LEGSADYLVTGDHHLLNLERVGNTKTIAPKDFLDLLSVL
jgi:predicted nucleic acid-binding protein